MGDFDCARAAAELPTYAMMIIKIIIHYLQI